MLSWRRRCLCRQLSPIPAHRRGRGSARRMETAHPEQNNARGQTREDMGTCSTFTALPWRPREGGSSGGGGGSGGNGEALAAVGHARRGSAGAQVTAHGPRLPAEPPQGHDGTSEAAVTAQGWGLAGGWRCPHGAALPNPSQSPRSRRTGTSPAQLDPPRLCRLANTRERGRQPIPNLLLNVQLSFIFIFIYIAARVLLVFF